MKKMKLASLPGLGRRLLLFALLSHLAFHSIAQNRSGTVADDAGRGLPGATVQVRGSGKAVATDASGRYRIDVPDDATLIISSVGYETREIAVAGRSVLYVVLVHDARNLNEVIVTALGIKREARRLGYSATTVNTVLITTNRTTNFGNSLEGKVSG